MGGGMGNRSFGIIPESTKQTAFHQLLSGYRERHAILPIGRDNTHIVLSVTPDKQCRQFDENWFKQITTSSNYDEVTELAKGYWSGKMTPNRIIEVLVTGKYEFLRKV